MKGFFIYKSQNGEMTGGSFGFVWNHWTVLISISTKGPLWNKWLWNATFILREARTMTAIWFIWCMMLFTFHVTHPEPYCGIRGNAGAPADNCAAWLKACDSVRSRRRDSTAIQFFCHAYDGLCVGSRRELWDTVLLQHPPGSAVHKKKEKKKNDTDYGRFMGVINTSSLMSLRTAFQPFLGRVSKWWMAGLFVLLVHSLSCLCSVSHPRCRSTFTIPMTLTASALPSRRDASSRPWPSSLRYGIIEPEG